MMLNAMRQACSMQCVGQCSGTVSAMHATNATNATDERTPRLGRNRRVSYAAGPVDNRVSRGSEWQKFLDTEAVSA